MKKKLLVAFFVAVIMCLFTFSASAANEVTLTDGTQKDFATVFKVEDNVVKGFNDGYAKDSIKDVTFPDEILGIKKDGLFGSAANLETITFAATDTFFIEGDTMFSNCSVKTVTFDPNCVVRFVKGGFYNCTSLTQITFPIIGELTASSLFSCCSNMVPTNNLVFAEGLTTIGVDAFKNCKLVGGSVSFPSTLKNIKEDAFNSTAITSFDLSKCVNLTEIGGGYGRSFANITTLKKIDFSACTNLTLFNGGSVFNGCNNLEEAILPPNLAGKLPNGTFYKCYALKSVVIPSDVTSIGHEAFHSSRKNQAGATFTLYLQGAVAFNSKEVFRDCSNVRVEIVLLGDVTAAQLKAENVGVDIMGSGNNSPMANIAVVDYLDPASPWTYVVGQENLANHVIVENYCTYLAKTGDHSETDTICENDDYCADCNYKTCESHTNTTVITYSNGYSVVGQKTTDCTPENCNGKATVELKPIFVTKGYSIKNDGCGITNDYDINVDALNEYKDYLADNGKTFTFGVFIGNSEYFTGNAFVNADGTINNSFSYIQAVNSLDYSKVKCTVADFTLAEKDLPLVMGIYVIDDGKVSYVQHEGTYEKEITKGGITLDVVTITKIAEISKIQITLPEPALVPAGNDEE